MSLITNRFNPISTTNSGFFFAFQVEAWKQLWIISVKLTWVILVTEIKFCLLLFCLVCQHLIIMSFIFRMRLYPFLRMQIYGLRRYIYRSVVGQLFSKIFASLFNLFWAAVKILSCTVHFRCLLTKVAFEGVKSLAILSIGDVDKTWTNFLARNVADRNI